MKKPLRTVLIVAFAALLAVSAAQLIRYALAYKKADDIYAESRTQYVETPAASAAVSGANDWAPITVDLASLQKANPEVAGWLYIPDTNISYPLLQGGDNDKYLHRSYDLQATAAGSIFMDYRNAAAFTDDNTVVYGHNMKNGSMFGSLKKYADTDYLKAHGYVYVILPGRTLRFRAFAAYRTEDTSESYTRAFADAGTDLAGFLQYIAASAAGNETDPPTEAAPLLTLSTCTSTTETGRFVVEAVLVGEKAD